MKISLRTTRKLATRAALLPVLFASAFAALGQTGITVDLNARIGAYKPIYSWFGYDEANYTTTQNGRELLKELRDLSPVPVYIRAHNLLTTGDGVPALKWSSTNAYTEDAQHQPVYDWKIVDGIFDAYRDAGVRPMVELGFMPEALSSHPGPYYVAFPGQIFDSGWAYPPVDYARWGELVHRFAEHLVKRYGREQTSRWYWEVWNEPDIGYWHGSPEDYDRLYDYAVAGVRAALPEAKVGGPASTGPHNERAGRFLAQFLKHVAEGKSAANGGKVPLDFISFHAKGAPRVVEGRVRMALDRELSDAADGFAMVSRYPQFAKLPIILSEADPEGCAACSAKEHPQNAYRNGPLYPCYTAAALKGLFELEDEYHVNLLGMLSWSFEFEGRESFEGFRSLATNGVDKPVLNVFRMAALLSGDRVRTTSDGAVSLKSILASGVRGEADVDALATRDGNHAGVLLWNYHDDDKPADGSEVKLTVTGLPAGVHRVLIEHYRIDESHSNSYAVWKAMGSPPHPDEAQTARLKEAGQLQLLNSPRWVEVQGGKASLQFPLPRQATSLVRLSW
jgi:xylan 1,4-beta-xylosidase